MVWGLEKWLTKSKKEIRISWSCLWFEKFRKILNISREFNFAKGNIISMISFINKNEHNLL